jgi:hypothetical protein
MSFVHLVINEAVENLSNSVKEKDSTFVKTEFLKSIEKPADTLEEIKRAIIWHIIPPKAIASINPPISRIYPVSPFGMPKFTISDIRLGRKRLAIA